MKLKLERITLAQLKTLVEFGFPKGNQAPEIALVLKWLRHTYNITVFIYETASCVNGFEYKVSKFYNNVLGEGNADTYEEAERLALMWILETFKQEKAQQTIN